MDVIEVLEEVKAAREQILKDETPVFFEIKTYRYKGHSMSDPAKYRTKEEMEKFQKQDPIQSLKDRMIEAKMLTEEDYKAMDKRLKGIVMESVKFAEESPEPPLSAMYDDILV
jgi:pyruvate dehydrogenase E1 component alpha subunit